MKSKIKATILILCALGALGLIPVFFQNAQPIEVIAPQLNTRELAEKEAQEQKVAAAQDKQMRARRMLRCQTSDDCIIVDKDPCGCLVGPKGVIAINANFTLDFNRLQEKVMAKACPDTLPSEEKECSPSAQAVCENNLCKITY